MQVIIETKSNYRGLNGKRLDVHECNKDRISCYVFIEESGKFQVVDFNIKEVKEIFYKNKGY